MTHFLPPGDYLPHEPPMLLLERVIDVTNDTARCQVSVSADGVLAPFLQADGALPGWYALELIAQTVGVWSGWHCRQRGERADRPGMVLGSRELTCDAGQFAAGAQLEIAVSCLMQDERLASFEGVIRANGVTLASGRVNTFRPSDDELTTMFSREGSV